MSLDANDRARAVVRQIAGDGLLIAPGGDNKLFPKGAKSAKGAAHGDVHSSGDRAQGEEEPPFLRQIYGVPFSTFRTRAKMWLWEENGHKFIPLGEAGYVAGPGGIGKTTYFLQQVVAPLTLGTLPGVFEGEPRNAAVFCAEDSYEHIVKPRLIAAKADLDRVFKIAARTPERDDLVPQFPFDADSLEEFLAAHEISFTLLDPVMSCLGNGIKHNDPQAIRSVFDAFQPVVERTDSSLISVMHLNRRHGEDAAGRMSGAHSYSDCARVGFVFAEVEEGSYVVSQKKNSYAPQKAPDMAYHFDSVLVDTDDGIPVDVGLVVVDGESEVSADDALTAPRQTAEEREETEDLASVLHEHFVENGVGEFREIPSSDMPRIAKTLGASVDQLKRAKRRAGIKSGKTQGAFSGGWVWYLTEPIAEDQGTEFAKGATKGADSCVPLPSLPSHPSGKREDEKLALPASGAPREPWTLPDGLPNVATAKPESQEPPKSQPAGTKKHKGRPSKLTPQQWEEAARMKHGGMSNQKIADHFTEETGERITSKAIHAHFARAAEKSR
ncbi:AAA family ATPase [Streptomyces hesseae]|uniref:AAA family ATPase n=1 Tax=Streptomyces hesseae TaxID=3075519 RepID=A0ABU2SLS4_9ACTN|nr:AAA family ATPase [Streptomyces sp. DSM 40473]MDT0449936.1 AAA family ATPase [Streptomyces sp. DSM 40473]